MRKVKAKRIKAESFNTHKSILKEKINKNEERYVITPKGCAYLAMTDCEIKNNEIDLNLFWERFCTYLESAGFVIE